jgi:ATP-dependent protease ClpP protease subunit/tetrahydromethanopterin S-methyltransferase subunit B
MAKWFDIKAYTDGGDKEKKTYNSIDLYIYDEIGGYGVQANAFVKALNEYKDADTINVRINSGGGSVIAGSVIYNALKRHNAKVITHIDGLSASMASVIAMVGDEVRMAENALLMIHNPWTQSQGEADDLRKEADLLDKIKETLLTAYKRSNYSEVELSELMDAETWFTAKEALEAGFIDVIDGATEKVAWSRIKDYDLPEPKQELVAVENAETYNDYPESATNNAKRAIKYKEENGSSCGTVIGWTRAGQLSRREKISRDTIARMASFKRHQQHKDVPYSEGCGGLMWDAWGGTSGVEWAISKLKQIDNSTYNKIMESINEVLEDTKVEVEATESAETEVVASVETEVKDNVVLEPVAEVAEEVAEVEESLADVKDSLEATQALVSDYKAKVELLETEIENKEAQFELSVKALEEKHELELAEAKAFKDAEVSKASAEVLASIGVQATEEVEETEEPKADTPEDFWAEYKSLSIEDKNEWYAQNKHRIGK